MVLRPLVLGGRPGPDGGLLLHDRAQGIAAALRAGPRLLGRRRGVPADDGRRDRARRLPPAAASRSSTTATSSIPAMLEAIEHAEVSINIEAYIYWAGHIGKRFAQALADRARAGVTVKILLDAVGSTSIGEDILQVLEAGGCQVAWYNPIHWYTLGRYNHRTHRKSLIIDGDLAFTGGAGIADQWEGARAGSRALARHPDSRGRPGRHAAADGVRGQLAAHDRRADLGPAVLPAGRSQRPAGRADDHQLTGSRRLDGPRHVLPVDRLRAQVDLHRQPVLRAR